MMNTEFFTERNLEGILVPTDVRPDGIIPRKRVYPNQFTTEALWATAARIVSLRMKGYFVDWGVNKTDVDEQARVNGKLTRELEKLEDGEEFEFFGIKCQLLSNPGYQPATIKILEKLENDGHEYYVNPISSAMEHMQWKIANDMGNEL